MSLTVDQVRDIFSGLASEETVPQFLAHVDPNVECVTPHKPREAIDEAHGWTFVNPEHTVEPLGVYHSLKDAGEKVINRVDSYIQGHLDLALVGEPIIAGNVAVIELRAIRPDGSIPRTKEGNKPFDNRHCCKILTIRTYVDSLLVAKTLGTA